MVATAHGVSLANLVRNPDLNALVGGVCQVTISDGAAADKGYVQLMSHTDVYTLMHHACLIAVHRLLHVHLMSRQIHK